MSEINFSWIKKSRYFPLRAACGIVWSIKNSFRYKSPVLIYRQADGIYINRRKDCVFVSPEVHAASFDEVSRTALDYWLPDSLLPLGGTVLDVGAGIGDEYQELLGRKSLGQKTRLPAILKPHPNHCFVQLKLFRNI